MHEASAAHALASTAKCRLVLFYSLLFLEKINYVIGIYLTDLPDESQEVVANTLREQNIIEIICAI